MALRVIRTLALPPSRTIRFVATMLTILIASLAGVVTATSATAAIVGTPIRTCIAPMRHDRSPRDLFKSATVGFDCTKPQSAYGSGDFDVIARALPPGIGRDAPVLLRSGSVWQDQVVIYALYGDGRIAHLSMDSHALAHHLQLGAVVETALPASRAPVIGLLWRVRGAANMRAVVLDPTIATTAQSTKSNLLLGALYAGFGGLCLALLVYNLALWRVLRHRFQLAYCAMVAVLALYAFSSSSALAWAVPSLGNNDRIRINYLAIAIAVVAAIAFARAFFEQRVFEGWPARLTTAVSAVVLIAAGTFVVFAPLHPVLFDRFYSTSILLVLLVVAPVLTRAWMLRSNYLWIFAIAWAAPISLAALRVASSLHIVPYGFWIDNSTLLAMTLEALLSSLAIAYRIHLLSRERDEAREQEIAARLLAATDPLTGLLNRRALLEQVIGRPEPQILLLVDLDHFKRVNETLGHDGGDEVLRVVARALRASVPPDALIARIGGEEFAILAPSGSTLSAAAVLESLRAERMPFDLTITASVGVCTGPLVRDLDWKMLYRCADRALFEAKAAGRDRAREATPILAAA